MFSSILDVNEASGSELNLCSRKSRAFPLSDGHRETLSIGVILLKMYSARIYKTGSILSHLAYAITSKRRSNFAVIASASLPPKLVLLSGHPRQMLPSLTFGGFILGSLSKQWILVAE